ncbi:hypothetical protein [Bradyrhizobium sp. OAE829]|uniref:hypothetical protein n=1 Tax=Bradyrhizobium sp. OAE829 TaxID=2663807 RepID=UPI00178B4373
MSLANDAVGQAQLIVDAVRRNDTAPHPTESDATAAADRVAEHWVKAAEFVVLACAFLVRALSAFAEDREKLDVFLTRLVVKRVFSENDVLARLKVNGKLAMLGKIGRNAETLLLPEVLRHLPAHYSIIYQICLLIEQVGLERAVAALAGHHDTTREDVIKMRAALKVPEIARESAAPPTVSDGAAELFAVRFTAEHGRIFANDYARPDTLDECLHRPQPADNAGLTAIVPIRMLGTFEHKLMPLLGFNTFYGVFLVAALNQPEITDRDVVVVAKRGSFRPLPMMTFPSDTGSVVELADFFFPDCSIKCQLFADARADGWSTHIGDENWHERPSVR